MNTHKRQLDPTLSELIRAFQMVTVLGYVYCMAVLLLDANSNAVIPTAVYALWFVIAGLSAHVMLKGDLAGVYGVGISTALLTVYDIVRGAATLGGATLGLLVLFMMVYYLVGTTPAREV